MDKDRRIALLALRKTDKEAAWSNLSVKAYIKSEGAENPAFVRELVFETLRNRKLIDYNIDRFLKRPRLGLTEREILRLGFAQAALLGGVAEHAAVSETVELASCFVKEKKGFVNAVLRSFQRDGARLIYPPAEKDPIEYLSVRYSVHESIARLWVQNYGFYKAEELLRISNTHPPFTVRRNLLKKDSENLKAEDLALDGEAFKSGLFSVQGEASQKAVAVLNPKPGEFIIDMCAAPGGKALASAELMGNKGKILAFDINEKRLGLMEKEAKRLGISIIETERGDSSTVRDDLFEKADAVTADVPCSGLGVLRRAPEIKYKDAALSIKSLVPLQKKIIRSAGLRVKPSGRLLYSTCTVSPEENSYICSDFLFEQRKFEKVYEEQLMPEEGGHDGFYICLMRKKC